MKRILNLARRLRAWPMQVLGAVHFQTRLVQEQLRLQDIQYRDVLDLVSGSKTLRHNDVVVLDTEFPVAYESLDHIHPFGTMQDNTRNYAFYQKCRSLYGEGMSFLDIGCSGGGLVFEFALNGHVAIGLEGSDLSQRRGRANWRTIPGNLFTCDVTQPFSLHAKKSKAHYGFDVVSAWEVFEHIPQEGLPQLFANVKAHLKPEGIFVGSISKSTQDILHVTVQDDAWWVKTFAKHGLDMQIGYDDVLEYPEFCRGIKGGLWDSHDYRGEHEKGLHFVARHLSSNR